MCSSCTCCDVPSAQCTTGIKVHLYTTLNCTYHFHNDFLYIRMNTYKLRLLHCFYIGRHVDMWLLRSGQLLKNKNNAQSKNYSNQKYRTGKEYSFAVYMVTVRNKTLFICWWLFYLVGNGSFLPLSIDWLNTYGISNWSYFWKRSCNKITRNSKDLDYWWINNDLPTMYINNSGLIALTKVSKLKKGLC